jgi:hypothetical protein
VSRGNAVKQVGHDPCEGAEVLAVEADNCEIGERRHRGGAAGCAQQSDLTEIATWPASSPVGRFRWSPFEDLRLALRDDVEPAAGLSLPQDHLPRRETHQEDRVGARDPQLGNVAGQVLVSSQSSRNVVRRLAGELPTRYRAPVGNGGKATDISSRRFSDTRRWSLRAR